ncbi:MAG: peptidylprolyl isomerase [Candidatus Hydrogenedentota bacterium]
MQKRLLTSTVTLAAAVMGAVALVGIPAVAQQVEAPPPPQEQGQPPQQQQQGQPPQGQGQPPQQPPQMQMPQQPQPPDVPDVVARVNGEEVTGEEFQEAYMQFSQMMMTQGQQPLSEQEVLDQLINTRILEMRAEEAGIEVPDEDVQEQLDELAEQFGGEEQLTQLLEQQGIDRDELDDMIRQDLRNAAFRDEITDVEVTDEEVQETYDELREMGEFEQGEQADIQHIFIEGMTEEDREAGEEEISDAYQRIADGEDFEDVASDVSEDPTSAEEGGRMEIERGMLPGMPEFEEQAFEAPIGEVSEPFMSEQGWHIMRVIEREEGGTVPLEEVEEDIREFVRQNQQGEQLQEWVEAEREEMDIEILMDPAEESEAPAAPQLDPDAMLE